MKKFSIHVLGFISADLPSSRTEIERTFQVRGGEIKRTRQVCDWNYAMREEKLSVKFECSLRKSTSTRNKIAGYSPSARKGTVLTRQTRSMKLCLFADYEELNCAYSQL
jgi:hypothetical protein